MPIYFFHIDDGNRVQDRLGVELPDPLRARREATLFAGELLRDRPEDLWNVRAWTMTVMDATGLTLFTIEVEGRACSEAIQPFARRG
jgi:hypothetical protein